MTSRNFTYHFEAMLLKCLRTLFLSCFVEKDQMFKNLSVSESPAIVIFWPRHPCLWSASEVAADLVDVSNG